MHMLTPDQVSIILDKQVMIMQNSTFKSCFLDRIIGEMKKKDSTEAENGKDPKRINHRLYYK